MARLKHNITNYVLVVFLSFAGFSCAATYESTTSSNNTKFTFTLGAPGYPNKRVSAYIFASGALIGVVRSNTMTDSKGNLTVTAQAVDSNNCPTGGTINHNGQGLSLHFRLDGEGNNSIINPTACLSDAGFLDAANFGYTYNYPTSYWPLNISYMSITSKVTYTLSGTGVASLTRKTRCSVVDGTIANPGYFTSSNMGYFEGDITYNAGGAPTGGSQISAFKIPYGTTGTYKYTCWIDANNSGTYNTGDKIATSTDPATMSTWTTVP